MTALQPFAQNIWTALAPHSFVGLHIGTRLTVNRLSSGKLLLHSPIPLSVEVRSAIDALGPAARIVCPNLFHHMYAAETAAAYPRTMLQDSECVALTCLIEANKSCDHEEKAFIFAAQGLIANGVARCHRNGGRRFHEYQGHPRSRWLMLGSRCRAVVLRSGSAHN
jgi:hypothetical protein